MTLPDVNVLIYAFRRDTDQHPLYRQWLLRLLNGDSAFGVSEVVLASVIRVTTHPRIFKEPSSLDEAVEFTNALRQHPLCRTIRPSTTHWELFLKLCRQTDVKGNLATDAWLAALAVESGCTWVTSDRDFARFPHLKWRHPLHGGIVENPPA